jgi:hypothetical protein
MPKNKPVLILICEYQRIYPYKEGAAHPITPPVPSGEGMFSISQNLNCIQFNEPTEII